MTQRFAFIALAFAGTACSSDATSPGALHLTFPAGAVSVRQGDSVDVTVGVARSNIDGTIQLAISEIPSGVTATIPDIPEGATSVAIRLRAAPTAPTTTSLFKIKGGSDRYAFNEAAVEVTVTARGAFTLHAAADTFYLPSAGVTLTSNLTIEGTDGFMAQVALESAAPAGITVQLSAVAAADAGRIPVRLTVGPAVTPGDHTVRITATAPGLPARTRDLVLRIDPATPGFLINGGNPAAATAVIGAGIVMPIPLLRSTALAGPATLAVVAPTPGLNVTFAPGSTLNEVEMTIAASSSIASGTYSVVLVSADPGVRSTPTELVVTVVRGLVRLSIAAAQNAIVDQPVLNAPRVQVIDNIGRALRYVRVEFRPVDGGSVTRSTAVTDVGGSADAGAWRVGTVARLYNLDIVVGDLPVTHITAQAAPGPAAQLTKISGDLQPFANAHTLAGALIVKVSDQFGNAVPNATVGFAPAAGSGNVAPGSAQTNSTGTAQTRWTVSSGTANQTVTASSAGAPPVVFTAVAVSCDPIPLNIGTQIVRAIDAGVSCMQPNTDAYGDAFAFDLTETRTIRTTSIYDDDYYSSQVSAWIANTAGDIVIPRVGLQPFAETLFTLPAGSYRLVMTVPPGGTAEYSLSSAFDAARGCVSPHVARGYTITGASELLDCELGLSRYDAWLVWMDAGQSITLTATSALPTAFGVGIPLEPERLSAISTSPSLTHTAAASGFYQVRLYSGIHEGPNTYTVTMQ